MGNPAKNLKQSLSDLLGAGGSDRKQQQQQHKDHKSSSQLSSKNRQKLRKLRADHCSYSSNSSNISRSANKSWRSSSLRACDLHLASGDPSPSMPAAAASAASSEQWKNGQYSFRNFSTNWSSGEARSGELAQVGGIVMRRSTSANGFASRTHEDDPSYLAFEKLFNQFQGKPPDTRKVLVTVTVLGATGRLRLFIADTATVPQVIAMALSEYAHEGRLPPLGRNAEAFHLYLTPFHPQSLPPQETIKRLGTRSFVLCPAANQAPSPRCKSSAPGMPKGSRSWWRIITGISSSAVALVS